MGADRNDYGHIVYFVCILGSLYYRRETWTAPSVWLAADHLEVSYILSEMLRNRVGTPVDKETWHLIPASIDPQGSDSKCLFVDDNSEAIDDV